MYASKRSVRRAQGVEKKYKEPTHSNRKATKGNEFRVQVIKDKFGFVVKRIVHYSPRRIAKLQKYNKLLEEYREAQMAAYQAQQEEGDNDVKGMEAVPAVEPVNEIVEIPNEETEIKID